MSSAARRLSASVFVLVALSVAAPALAAAPEPAIYFLVDGPSGPATPGILEEYNFTVPNFPDSNTSSTRPVFVGQEAALPVRFIDPDTAARAGYRMAPSQALEQPIVLVWLAESVVVQGNLTATLSWVKGSTVTELSTGSAAIDTNTSKVPDPTTLVPPDPTDPEGSAGHVLAQVLPYVLKAPLVIMMDPIDSEVPDGASLALTFSITQGSSPVPVPAGAFAQLQYDGLFTPSLVVIPWIAPDPPAAPPVPPTSSPPGGSSPPPNSPPPNQDGGDAGDDDGKGKGSPGAPLIFVVLAVAGLAALRRR